ncbi:CRISPR-associated protein Cas4 [Chakrabartyella piscis]|uniref:CRISPR-associated protein Cas4 n=1 Tax=Chakrabartyella piscis TaxID=2918914 RepID=UPI0029586932|nr:CRISPR-associated protein Cas4 [Chakrabartyella piscis]
MSVWDWCLFGCVIALVLLILLKRNTGKMQKLPASQYVSGYTLFYADQKQKGKEGFGKMLKSEKYDLRGKPDYIYRKRFGKMLMPVELKSGKIGDADVPHLGDLMQLCAYFLMIEDIYGVRPKEGRLVYADYMFLVQNTKKLRKEVLSLMEEMRNMLETGEGAANADFATCRYCVCNGVVCEHSETEIYGGN